MKKSAIIPKDKASKIISGLGADPLWYVTERGIMKAHLDVLREVIPKWGERNVCDFMLHVSNTSAALKFKKLPEIKKNLELLLHFYKPISKILQDRGLRNAGYYLTFADTRDLEKGMRVRLHNSKNNEAVADFNFDLDLSLKNDPMVVLANRQIMNPEENSKLKERIKKPALDLFLGLFKEAFHDGLIFALHPKHHTYNHLYDAASMKIITSSMLTNSELNGDEYDQVLDWLDKEHGQLGEEVRQIFSKLSTEEYDKVLQWIDRADNPHSSGVRKILKKISQIAKDNRDSHFAALNRIGFETRKKRRGKQYFLRKP